MSDKCPYDILYEDEKILVVYKKRDVFTIRTNDKKTFSHNLYHYLKMYLFKKRENLFIVHRLDYETSGIILFAKSYQIKQALQKCFEERKVTKLYEGVVAEKIPLNKKYHVVQYLKKEGMNVVVSSKEDEEAKEAITDIESINYIQIGTALKIAIDTGRHNQIRLAIHSLGLTLLGDKRFCNSEAKRMYLNAYSLSFPPESGLTKTTFSVDPLWIVENKPESK